MFKNKINPVIIFGIFLLCLSCFLLSVAGQIYADVNNFDQRSLDQQLPVYIFGAIGIGLLIFSAAFLLKLSWARVALSLLFLLVIVGWTGVLLFMLKNVRTPTWLIVGASILIFGSMFAGVLFLNNYFVIKLFRDEYEEKEDRSDILDL